MGSFNFINGFSIIVPCLLILIFLIIAVIFLVRKKTILPIVMLTLTAVSFTVLAWNHSFLIYFGLAIAFVLIFICLLIYGIILIIKKSGIKRPVITLAATAIIFSTVAGCVAISEYQKDKWFYSFRSYIIKQYHYVKKIELNPGRGGLSLFVYCDENFSAEDSKPVVTTIKHYLFNNPSGKNPSQQTYIKRGQGEYELIYISFFKNGSEKNMVSYESGYYTDGLRNEVGNFKIWYVNMNGKSSQLTIE